MLLGRVHLETCITMSLRGVTRHCDRIGVSLQNHKIKKLDCPASRFSNLILLRLTVRNRKLVRQFDRFIMSDSAVSASIPHENNETLACIESEWLSFWDRFYGRRCQLLKNDPILL